MSYINPEQVEFAIAHLGNLKARFNVFISSPKLYMKKMKLSADKVLVFKWSQALKLTEVEYKFIVWFKL